MKTLAKLSLWVLAFTPLVLIDNITTLFGKMIFVRVMLLLASAFFFFYYIDKPKFRMEIRGRVAGAVRNPLVISVLAFVTIATISAFLAVSPFKAFFGNLDRSEGLLGLLCYFTFFVYSYLLFNHEDWIIFFKLSIAAGLISVVKAASEYTGGMSRPKAFTGNTEYLAGYLLFVVFAAVIVFVNSPKKSIWRYMAAAGGAAGVAGIVLTQTRGAILGLAVAAAVLAVYGLICGKNVKLLGRVSARTVALVLIVLAIVSGGLFLATKDAAVWQKVPGISRIAKADVASSNSVKTRLISLKTSWRAVTESGPMRGLLGYGPDNFNIAFGRFYDPTFYEYEHGWLDRAHNKIMDVAVMNGVLGLLAYLAIWAAVIWLVFRRRPVSPERLAMLLFSAAYFTYLMTMFDQVTTYISFFAALAFLLCVTTPGPAGIPEVVASKKGRNNKLKEAIPKNPADIIAWGLVSVALAWVAIVWTFIPFNQLSNYRIMMVLAATDSNALADIDSTFTPYTFCQQEIRMDFLRAASVGYNQNLTSFNLFLKALTNIDTAEQTEPYNPLYLQQAGIAYDKKSTVTNKKADLQKAEAYYRRALALAPLRQDIAYSLTANLVSQNRADDAVNLMRKELAADDQAAGSHYYLGYAMSKQGGAKYAAALKETETGLTYFLYKQYYPESSADTYKDFARYFYGVQDKTNFVTVMKRLSVITPADKDKNAKLIELANNGSWSDITIE
jgi:O-antigen ligase